jgi:DNA gyrase inhibitor GyrI
MTAVTVAHLGSYMEINRAFDRLFGWLASRDLIGPDLRSFAILYDDVATVPAAKLRSRAGVITARKIAVEPPVELTEIVGGDDAVLQRKGPYADMEAAYDWLYGRVVASIRPRAGRWPRPRRVSQQPARHGAAGTAVRYLPALGLSCGRENPLTKTRKTRTDKLNSPDPACAEALATGYRRHEEGRACPGSRPSGSSTSSSARSQRQGHER